MKSSSDAPAPAPATTQADTEPRHAPPSEPTEEPTPSRRELAAERFLTAHYPFGFQVTR